MKRKIIILLLISIIVSLIPLSKAENINYAPITAFISNDNPRMPYSPYNYAELLYYGGVDNSPMIRIKPNSEVYAGEVDSVPLSISPNQHIKLGGYIKTTSFTQTQTPCGVAWGFDFTTHVNGSIWIVAINSTLQAGHPQPQEWGVNYGNTFGYTVNGAGGLTQINGLVCKVPFGVSYWQKTEFDFIVPNINYTWVWGNDGCVENNSPVQIDGIVMWSVVRDNGEAFFSSPFLYINPTSEPTAQPTIRYYTNIPIPETTTSNNILSGILTPSNQTSLGYLFIFAIFGFIIFYCISLLFGKKRR